MKKIFIILVTVTLYITGFSQKYFEGTVDYDITYAISNPGIPEDALKSYFGTKMTFSHKDGTYMREYFDENGKSLRKYIYLATDNKLYVVDMNDTDTVYVSDAAEKLTENYKIVKGPNETILGCNCPSHVITYKYFEKAFRDTVNTKLEYYFCHDLPVNPEYYKNYYIWYDVVKQEKSVAIKFTEDTEGFFMLTYTGKKINKIKVDDKVFEFDKNAVLVDMKSLEQ
jgi:hypothetical protein